MYIVFTNCVNIYIYISIYASLQMDIDNIGVRSIGINSEYVKLI